MAAGENEAQEDRHRRRIEFYERQTAVANSVSAVLSRVTVVIGSVAALLYAVDLVVEPSLRFAVGLVVSVVMALSAGSSIAGEKRRKREQGLPGA